MNLELPCEETEWRVRHGFQSPLFVPLAQCRQVQLAVVIRNTIAGGRLQGVLTGVGHALGVGVYALVAVFGMALVLQQFPQAMRGIEILGGLYLLWMGYQAFQHAGEGSLDSSEDQGYRGFVDGLAISRILRLRCSFGFTGLLYC